MKSLLLGGIRSGKSRLAEVLAADSGLEVCYIATAEARDDEMRARIDTHQARRPSGWRNVEEPLALARVIRDQARPETCLLVDCLSLWLTNLLMTEDRCRLDDEIEALLTILPDCPGEIIFVSTESNLGVVPMGELSRRYCDQIGLLHQDIARLCDRVVLVVAGLPHYLKGAPD